MDLTYLKKLVRIVENSGVDEIEVEEEGLRIRVARNSHRGSAHVQGAPAHEPATISSTVSVPPPETPLPPATSETKYHEIKSPIVGTFYRAPAPDADPYIEVGQVVQPKTVLCIIEAMKLMNEIESDIGGKIVKIMVDSGKPV